MAAESENVLKLVDRDICDFLRVRVLSYAKLLGSTAVLPANGLIGVTDYPH